MVRRVIIGVLLSANALSVAFGCSKPEEDHETIAENAGKPVDPTTTDDTPRGMDRADDTIHMQDTQTSGDAGRALRDAGKYRDADAQPDAPPPPPPDGPMQAWMKSVATEAYVSKNPEKLARAFDTMATFGVVTARATDFPNWISVARDGANVARRGEVRATTAACRSCHEQYLAKYRSTLHDEPL